MSPRGARFAALALSLGAVVALGGRPGTATGTDSRASGYRIVLESDFDRTFRGYTIRPDGSGLTPLLPPNREFIPFGVSRDGRTIAYYGSHATAIYVSRGSGAGLRFVVRTRVRTGLWDSALSPDGRMVAYSVDSKVPLAVVRTNGRGHRVLASARASDINWSPDGTALSYTVGKGEQTSVLIQPLRGRGRVLARNASAPQWSPAGRWIAYISQMGTWLVRPDGRSRHRLSRAGALAWSTDGRTLALADGRGIALIRTDGRVSRRIRVQELGSIWGLLWAPGGRSLLVENSDPHQIWIVDADGRGLRRVTRLGNSVLIGWTGLAPSRRPVPPIPPSSRAIGPRTVATSSPIRALSADGERVAFAAQATAAECGHVAVWTPATRALGRFGRPAPCGEWPPRSGIYDVELAGSRAAWAVQGGCGNFCDHTLASALIGSQAVQELASTSDDEEWNFHVRGDGDLLVFDDRSRLVRIGSGGERCQEGLRLAAVCTTLRRGDHAAPVESVSEGLIAVRENDAVAVLDERGALVRLFPFAESEVTAARLDGAGLVVTRAGVIEVYNVATGAGELQQPLPPRFRLVDVDGGIAVLLRQNTVMLLRLQDGRTRTLTPGRGPVLAELEAPGLYYSYATGGGGGRVVFAPRSEAEPAQRAG